MKYLLISFVNSNTVNLRTILRLYGKEYRFPHYEILSGEYRFHSSQISITILFDFLLHLFGNTASLKKAIDQTVLTASLDKFRLGDHVVIGLTDNLMILAGAIQNGFYESGVKRISDLKDCFYTIEITDRMRDIYGSVRTTETGQAIRVLNRDDLKVMLNKAFESFLLLEKVYV